MCAHRVLVTLVLGLWVAPVALADAWPTRGHDARRTGQSSSVGPQTPADVTTFTAAGEMVINIPPTAAADGTVYFGTWGVIRDNGEEDPRGWDKFDGSLFAVDGQTAASPWTDPFQPDLVHYCYDYDGRADPGYCPQGGAVSWYNGTVEGTAALSQDGRVVYVGRGDGKLYAVDAATGVGLWTFATFNPVDPADPDGGGEVVGGPLLGPDGALYFATVAAGPHETNAIYAVNPDGSLRWRYPGASPGLSTLFWASPALSPDGSTGYFAGGWGPGADDRDPSIPGRIYAFDLAAPSGDGAARLKWTFDPRNEAAPGAPNLFAYAVAVGADGDLYVAGTQYDEARWGIASVYALRDEGDGARFAWPTVVHVDGERAAVSLGLALREEGGATTRIYATSGNGIALNTYPLGGALAALDPTDGHVLWTFDPEDHSSGGAMAGIALDADGVIYTGVSGRSSGGTVFAIDPTGALKWKYTLGGLLEWGHPVLGPDGAVYVADTRRCIFAYRPIEDGLCDAVNINPQLYAIRGGGGTGGCDTSAGSTTSWGLGALLLALGGLARRHRS